MIVITGYYSCHNGAFQDIKHCNFQIESDIIVITLAITILSTKIKGCLGLHDTCGYLHVSATIHYLLLSYLSLVTRRVAGRCGVRCRGSNEPSQSLKVYKQIITEKTH